ncbi:Xylulose 5-phosphate/phosphate translocator chloroplastic [Euphorbia peplus]|nr:Xylulose 5-phosphate/phosphate translocator chloroplastic [Euphorbia peplus]
MLVTSKPLPLKPPTLATLLVSLQDSLLRSMIPPDSHLGFPPLPNPCFILPKQLNLNQERLLLLVKFQFQSQRTKLSSLPLCLASGDTYPLKIWLSILPIVLGCSLAAVTEVSFNFQGLWGALISNVGFVFRNIYSKKSLQSFKEVNGLNMYGVISIISLIYLFPVAVYVEGSQWVQGYHNAIANVGKPSTFYMWVLVAGIFYHLYNQSSYQALDDISPLTFSVGNTMKRVVVIVSTILVFRNPVRPLNAVGSAIAILGTFLYSQASSKKVDKTEGEKKN